MKYSFLSFTFYVISAKFTMIQLRIIKMFYFLDFERKIARLEKEMERFEEEKTKMATLQSNSEIMKGKKIWIDRYL